MIPLHRPTRSHILDPSVWPSNLSLCVINHRPAATGRGPSPATPSHLLETASSW
jgi:hypothetical protein